jgi:GxxExxY protein
MFNGGGMNELLWRDEVFSIVGAAMEVHGEFGPGFLEGVYHEAMELELMTRGVPFESQKPLSVWYKGKRLRKEFLPDMLCYGNIVVELKSLDRLGGKEQAQLLNYLKASRCQLGLLINFGSHGRLEWQRYVM